MQLKKGVDSPWRGVALLDCHRNPHRVYFAAGLNHPMGGCVKLAKFLGTLLVQAHGEGAGGGEGGGGVLILSCMAVVL